MADSSSRLDTVSANGFSSKAVDLSAAVLNTFHKFTVVVITVVRSAGYLGELMSKPSGYRRKKGLRKLFESDKHVTEDNSSK